MIQKYHIQSLEDYQLIQHLLPKPTTFIYIHTPGKTLSLEQQDVLSQAKGTVIFHDKGGDGKKKPLFELLMQQAKSGDILVCYDLFSLGSTPSDMSPAFQRLNSRGIHLEMIQDAWMNQLETPLISTILNSFSQTQDKEISLRIQHRRAKTVQAGEARFKRVDTEKIEKAIREYQDEDNQRSVVQIAEANQVSKATLYRYLKARGLK